MTEITFWQILSYSWQLNLVLLAMLLLAILWALHLLLLMRSPIPAELLRQTFDDMVNGDLARARQRAEEKPSLLSTIIVAGLNARAQNFTRISAAIENSGRRAVGKLRQKINYLAHLGVISPMLGLLGTVLGLTKAFNALSNDGTENLRSMLMTTYVGEAMGATALGLFVGIIATMLYFIGVARWEQLSSDLEVAGENIANALTNSEK